MKFVPLWLASLLVLVAAGRARSATPILIDNNCKARVLAWDGTYLYWIDQGDTKLRRSKIENGTLHNSNVKVVDTHADDIALAAENGTIYWVEQSGDLKIGKINASQDRDATGTLGHGYTAQSLGAGGGRLFLKHGTNLRRCSVFGNVIQPATCTIIDTNAQTRSFAALSSDMLFWVDTNGSGHMGRVDASGQLHSDLWSQPNWGADLVAGQGHTLFWKFGTNLWRQD